jgi:hypothetical protein
MFSGREKKMKQEYRPGSQRKTGDKEYKIRR